MLDLTGADWVVGGRPSVRAVGGMVAAAHPLAANAGAEMLRRGGNAFDAVAATAAALNVVEPYMSGLAGAGAATYLRADTGAIACIDFIPPAPCTKGSMMTPAITSWCSPKNCSNSFASSAVLGISREKCFCR